MAVEESLREAAPQPSMEPSSPDILACSRTDWEDTERRRVHRLQQEAERQAWSGRVLAYQGALLVVLDDDDEAGPSYQPWRCGDAGQGSSCPPQPRATMTAAARTMSRRRNPLSGVAVAASAPPAEARLFYPQVSSSILHTIHRIGAGITRIQTPMQSIAAPARAGSRLCARCGERKAALKRPKTLEQICRECFYIVFEDEIHRTIVDNNLFKVGERVAIGASGGKDSTVLAYVLSELNKRHNYGLNLFLLSIDEGITGYRDDSLETVKRNELQYGLPLKIVSYKDLYDWTMDDIVKAIGLKNNCTFCGIYSPNAYRGFAREFIKDLERMRPRAILDIITSGENFRISTTTRMPEQGTCERCGYISSQKLCKACVLLDGLNRGLPKLGIGRTAKSGAGADGNGERQGKRPERNRLSLQGKHGNLDF
uniref:Uncharacterized protein n=1 Tax=Avena sativa TaxID=4498 RepID=A0ACD5ZK28_AVESA